LTQFYDLLDKLKLQKDDKLVFVGDLIDKGPNSAGVVNYVSQLAYRHELVLLEGNHEEKFFRFLKKIDEAPEYIQEMARSLTEPELKFLQSGVLFHRISDDYLVVHGGILPEHEELPEDPANLSKKQKKSLAKLLRARFVRGRDYEQREFRFYDESGKCVSKVKVGEGEPEPPTPEGCTANVKINIKEKGTFLPWKSEGPEDVFWADVYDGKHGHVIFGHESFKDHGEPKRFPHATGIDLGCVMGGKLCAAVLEEGKDLQFVMVDGLPEDEAVPDLGE
jgi:diadenosine tetraphosphatase ApaH/serine/threonine PP2A family protein phosphatase